MESKYKFYKVIGENPSLIILERKKGLYSKQNLTTKHSDAIGDISGDREYKDSKIYATAKGLIYPRFPKELSEENKLKYFNYFNESYGQGADFAIVQIDSLKGKKCIRLAKESPKAGERIYRNSFGASSRRNSSGDIDYRSYFEGSVLTASQFERESKYLASKSKKVFYVFSDDQTESGNSGSSLINGAGEVSGVLSFKHQQPYVLDDGSIKYLTGNIKMKSIFDSMSGKKLKNLFKLNNKCEFYNNDKDGFYSKLLRLDRKTKYGFIIKEIVHHKYAQAVLESFKFMESVQLSHSTPHHKKIFGEALSGQSYINFFKDLKTVTHRYEDSWMGAAHVDSKDVNKIILGNGFMLMPYLIDRVSILMHEAGHLGERHSETKHENCPTNDIAGSPLIGYQSKVALEGRPACDSSRYSAYAIVSVAMNNIAKYCTNCSEEDRGRASFLSSEMLKRIINKQEYNFLLNDMSR